MEEASVGKITRKFTVKTLLWFVLIDIVIGFIFLIAKSSGLEGIEDDEMGNAINGIITGLIVINIISAICSPLLALRGTKKKCKITSENSIQKHINCISCICINNGNLTWNNQKSNI